MIEAGATEALRQIRMYAVRTMYSWRPEVSLASPRIRVDKQFSLDVTCLNDRNVLYCSSCVYIGIYIYEKAPRQKMSRCLLKRF